MQNTLRSVNVRMLRENRFTNLRSLILTVGFADRPAKCLERKKEINTVILVWLSGKYCNPAFNKSLNHDVQIFTNYIALLLMRGYRVRTFKAL